MDSKILTVLVDAIASCVILLAARFYSPSDAQLVKELVLAMQPAVIVLIGAITYQQKAAIDAKARVDVAAAYGKAAVENQKAQDNLARARCACVPS